MSGPTLFEIGELDSFSLSHADSDFDPFAEVCGNSEPTQIHVEQPHVTETPETNKRRRVDSPSTTSDSGWRGGPASPESAQSEEYPGSQPTGTLKVTDAIDRIAAEGTALRFDAESQVYVVLDGPQFEARFQQLRTVRAKRNEKAQPRPFSKLHVYYILVKGDKWGKTGTAFKAKEAASETHACDRVEASNVLVSLFPSDDTGQMKVTLQHFLNVIGAGDTFKHARQGATLANESPAGGVFGNSESDAISEVVHDMWHKGARGDQGYFFLRAEEQAPFANGTIVKLVDGKLRRDDFVSEQSVFLVVSDLNVKWKGEPLPSREQEREGHWCCFLGQVPVTVAGSVHCGDYIGPRADGSGCGEVCCVGSGGSVVGIALSSKHEEAAGVVKTMCFVGLNAMNAQVGTKIGAILEEAVRTRGMVEELRLDVEQEMAAAKSKQQQLAARVYKVEQLLSAEEARALREKEAEDSGRCPREVEGEAIEMKIMGVDESGKQQGMWAALAEREGGWKRRWRLMLSVAVVCVLAVAAMSGYSALGGRERVVVQETVVVQELVKVTAPVGSCLDHRDAYSCAANSSVCVWAHVAELGELCVEKPVHCKELETVEACEAEGKAKCGWVQVSEQLPMGCFDAEEAEVLRCAVVERAGGGESECSDMAKCQWVTEDVVFETTGAYRVESYCTIHADYDPSVACTAAEKSKCKADERCLWVQDGRDEHCAVISETCGAAEESHCVLEHGCAWVELREADPMCIALDSCGAAPTPETCERLEETLRCEWYLDVDGAGKCAEAKEDDEEDYSYDDYGDRIPAATEAGLSEEEWTELLRAAREDMTDEEWEEFLEVAPEDMTEEEWNEYIIEFYDRKSRERAEAEAEQAAEQQAAADTALGSSTDPDQPFLSDAEAAALGIPTDAADPNGDADAGAGADEGAVEERTRQSASRRLLP